MEINLDEELELGEIELDIIEVYPELENIEITPTTEEQNFKSGKYGFDNVKVKGIETEEVNIVPSTEQQTKEGLFNKVTVEKITGDNLEITPTLEEQNFTGVYTEVKTNAITGEELTITPSAEEQVIEGIITKVTVEGSSDLQPQNIVKDKEIFGVQGTFDGIDTSDATGEASDVLLNKIVYSKGRKLVGTYEASSDYNAKVEPSSTTFTVTTAITEIGDIDTTGVTNMKNAFLGCSNLTKVGGLDTSEVTIMEGMFQNCSGLTELDLSNFNTSKVTTMQNMFYNCSKLTTLDLSGFDTSNVTYMLSMFYGCSKLTTLDVSGFDTSKVTAMNNMFYNCRELTELSELNAESCENVNNMFSSCSSLVNFGGLKDFGKACKSTTTNSSYWRLTLSSCNQLTHDSLINVINNLYDLNLSYDVANGGTLYNQSLVLGSTNKAKLTEEEIAVAVSKGWNVS